MPVVVIALQTCTKDGNLHNCQLNVSPSDVPNDQFGNAGRLLRTRQSSLRPDTGHGRFAPTAVIVRFPKIRMLSTVIDDAWRLGQMGVFVLLIGFPGVGKLTIAKELRALIPAKIVDNHWFNNPILRLLDEDGTTPLPKGIWEHTGQIRQTVLNAIATYSSPLANFIFTHAGVEGDERSARTYQQFVEGARQCDAVFVPVRLLCAEEELARRVSCPTRSEHLKSTNAETSRTRSSDLLVLDMPHHNGLTLDVTLSSPLESATEIRNHLLRVAQM